MKPQTITSHKGVKLALDEVAKELAKLAAKLEHEELMLKGSLGDESEEEDA
jgi:hypothetical protein